jgi:RHS repeat-associated protein
MMPRHLIPLRKLFMMGLALGSVLLCCVVETKAQNIQFTQGSVGSGLDNTIEIPITGYPGRGSNLPVRLYYSSRVWRIGHLATVNNGNYQSIAEAIFAEHSVAGWTTSLNLPIIEWPKEQDQYYYTGKQFCFVCGSNLRRFRVARVFIHMPDGTTHELRQSDQPYEGALRVFGTFYAVDGSRLRYDSTSATTGTLYLPDGSHFVLNSGTGQFIDRNGNTLTYNGSAWTDTLNRTVGMPFPAVPSPTDYPYTPPGIRADAPYIFRWRRLSDPGVLTDPSIARKPIANEYLPFPNQAPTNSSGNNYPHTVQPSYSERPSLFITDWPDEESDPTIVVGRGQQGGELFDPVVLAEVVLPNGLSYKFTYNIYGEIDKIVYPTGAFQKCQFTERPPIGDVKLPYSQANRVVTQAQLSPQGDGSDLATWQYAITGSPNEFNPNTLVISTTAPDGTYTEVRKHNIPAPLQSGTHSNPHFWPFGFEDPRQGMAYDERAYDKAPALGGVMLRRSLNDFGWTDNPVPPRIGLPGELTVHAFRNARPTKTVSLILDTGGDALAKLVTYGYNSNPGYALTTGLDRTHTAETYFASIDPVTAQSGTVNTISTSYYFPPATSSVMTYVDDANYQYLNILGLVSEVVQNDSAGQPVAKSKTFYDEFWTFPLITYSDLVGDAGYTNPGSTTVRGNATTVQRYVDVNAQTYLETHVQFDECGSVINTWNERAIAPFTASNASSRNEYSSAHKHAYFTSSMTAVPDPSGAHGASVALTSSNTFDSTTGLLLSTTSANGEVSNFIYQDDQGVTDPLNRLRKVTRPDGGWTKYTYGDTLGNLFTLTETKQDANRTVKVYEYIDALGRPSRNFASEGGANYIAGDTIYDQMGRVWKVSNPYRTTSLNGVADISHTSDWTVSHYEALGRLDSVTLPDASMMQTSYQGIYTTVTDQEGRQRRQKADALGRIIRVDEPNLSGALGVVNTPNQPTFYQYNTQGDLVLIAQGLNQPGLNPEDPASYLQHRYFKYDGLGRLTYERQVEQAGSITTGADPLTGNTAWSRRLVYDETIDNVNYKGLLTSTYDARTIQTQFRYDYLNRIWQVAYSDGTPTVTNNYDQSTLSHSGFSNLGHLTEASTVAMGSIPATIQSYNFDHMGRVANSQQTVGSQSYSMSYTYNLSGTLTSETYPSGRVVSYAFDDGARLSQVSSGSKIYANQFDYSTTQGLIKSVTLGNGAVETYSYNSRLQVTGLDLTRSGAQLQHYNYNYGVYDPATNTVDETKNGGRIARIEGFIAAQKQWQQNFAYDSLGRLSSAREFRGDNGQQSWKLNYDYDAFGNRYQKQANNPGNPFPQMWTEVADINQGTNRYANGLSYDSAGNVLIDQKFRLFKFQYDANNRQKQSSNLDDTGAVVSVYDAGGQRVATQVAGALSNVLVYDAAGKLLAEYGSTSPGEGTQYVFNDQQASPRVITNGSGAVVSRHDYAPFGEDIPGNVGMRSPSQGYAQPDGVRLKYAGMEIDEATGMSHTLWRQYDSLSARWSAPDPYSGSMSTSNPQSLNRYSYVDNDPVNSVDPSGLIPYSGADVGWADVANGFWGTSFDFNAYHFGGPEAIAEAEARHDRWVDIDRAGGEYGDDDYPSSSSSESSTAPAGTPCAADGTLSGTVTEGPAPPPAAGGENEADPQSGSSSSPPPQTPLTSVTVLGKTVQITYASGLSTQDQLAASNKISAAAGVLNKNAKKLTKAEKNAIGQITTFSVVGSNTYLGATGAHGFTLSINYINASSPAWIASLFGHEGKHHLNGSKYTGKNLWRDEQSAGRLQLGIGRKIGFTKAETKHLRKWISPKNKAGMQKHMTQGLKM